MRGPVGCNRAAAGARLRAMTDPTGSGAGDLAAATRRLDEAVARALAWLAEDAPRLGGRVTRRVDVGPGAIERAAGHVAAGGPAQATIVCDVNTRRAAGEALATALARRGRAVEVVVLEPRAGRAKVVCDDETVAQVEAAVAGAGAVVAVGSGTVCDCVKLATARRGKPFAVVATAASMNGYTSAIAAVLSRGVKRTVPAHMAEAVFADPAILAAAPPEMNRAGFGDLASKPYSHMDWLLAHHLRGAPYDPRPAELLAGAFERLLDAAHLVGSRDPAALGVLMRTIVVSGFSMALAGSSSPASGGEHLASHYWDMERFAAGALPRALHGLQVGVATVLSARLFERLLAADVPALLDRAAPFDPRRFDRLDREHPTLPPAIVAEIRAQFERKQRIGQAQQAERRRIAQGWPALAQVLAEAFMPARRIEAALRAAGCPTSPAAFGVDRDHARRTLRVCRQIRDRYVGLDLLADAGVLDPWSSEVVDEVYADAGG